MSDTSNSDYLNYYTSIGGSQVGTILGRNKYETPYQLWRKFVQLDPPFTGNEATRWGIYFEDMVAKAASERLDIDFRRSNKVHKHPTYCYLDAHIDRHSRKHGILLECKTTTSRTHASWGRDASTVTSQYDCAGVIPEMYYWQVQHYLMITGLDVAYLAVAILDNRDIRLYQILPNQADQEFAVEECIKFWGYVQNSTPPPKLSSDDYDLMFPDCESQATALLSEKDTQIFDSYYILKQEEQDAINRRKDCEAKIKFLIGECEVAEHNGEKLATWKSQNSSRLDTARLKQDHPEICEEYQKTANYRVLRVL